MSLDIEWSFICGEKKFSWYMVRSLMAISRVIESQTNLRDTLLCRSVGSSGRHGRIVSRYLVNVFLFGLLMVP